VEEVLTAMTTTSTSLELESYPKTSRSEQQEQQNHDKGIEININSEQLDVSQGLEPADGGSSAWKLLLGAFLFEAILWGKYPRS
jgi:hypothetical protein